MDSGIVSVITSSSLSVVVHATSSHGYASLHSRKDERSSTSKYSTSRYRYLSHAASFSTIYCDGCQTTPIRSSRYLCIECSEGEVDGTLDICGGCFAAQPDTLGEPKKAHIPSHPFLQIRVIRWRIYRHSTIEKAKSVLAWVNAQFSTGSEAGRTDVPSPPVVDGVIQNVSQFHKQCVNCGCAVESPPFWCCVDCGCECGRGGLLGL